MQAFSSDQGRTWGAATVLQDFDGQADFNPALVVAGEETFLFFSAFSPQFDIYFRRSTDSAKDVDRAGEAEPAESHHALQRHPPVRGRTLRAASLARNEGWRRLEIERWRPDVDAVHGDAVAQDIVTLRTTPGSPGNAQPAFPKVADGSSPNSSA
jgi:hypothetical protein